MEKNKGDFISYKYFPYESIVKAAKGDIEALREACRFYKGVFPASLNKAMSKYNICLTYQEQLDILEDMKISYLYAVIKFVIK